MSDDYRIPDLSHSDFDDIRHELVDGWWCRPSVGPHAIAPGWWWASSLAVRNGHVRMFRSEEDARAWAGRHDWIRDAYRPDDWVEDLLERLR